ncbi:hypothetical protein [Streptomyces sp. NPDC002564]|uniref:effector-associated constant component EACC1 n=1 Tax=Streptomyces sp. NPDC002564 TaxID=3364649 RepID=UPI0036AD52F4
MRLELSLPGTGVPEEELRSLHGWLLSEPAARRHARPELGASQPSPPGAQGDLIDLVSLLVGSGFSAASLALSLHAWRATRPQGPTITVERPDGQRITLSAATAEEARLLLASLVDGAAPAGGNDGNDEDDEDSDDGSA